MITAFNAILECMVTGMFCALFIILGQKLGWIPMFMMMITPEELEDMQSEEDEL